VSKKSAAERRQENLRRHESNIETKAAPPRRTWGERLDRIAAWLGRLSRPVRILMAAVLALLITLAAAVLAFGFLFSLNTRQFGSNPSAIILPTIIGLTAIGFISYWIGWRVLVGFDFGEEPLHPGRPAARWLIFVALTVIGTALASLIGVLQAFGPVQ